ncbi:MAG: zinc-binding dehydrogenase [Flavobacteriales bacterium]|nr:zinc-binding dehydrogenase [Flavobacteriales bacterium]MCB9193232.1 zinc-binding dehydrogenase [Flavobacteriales bacterium]
MRAWILTQHGDPARVLTLGEASEPRPAPRQVRVRVEGFGLNYADVMAVRGLYREAPPLPSVLGYEVVGRVDALGGGAPKELIGQRVLALTRFGGYAEYACTDHRAVVPIPEDMPLGEALALGTQGCTAWFMAEHACRLEPGMRVLVHGAAGGVGQLLVQIALRRECDVFAVASGTEKLGYLRRIGAHHVIDRKAAPYDGQLRDLLGDKRMHVSFNAVAGATFPKDMRLVGTGGVVVLFGGAERGRMSTWRFVWNMGLVLPIFLMMKSKSIVGVNMLKLGDHDPDRVARCLREVVRAHASGMLKPHVHHVHAAGDLPNALTDLAGGITIGKLGVQW